MERLNTVVLGSRIALGIAMLLIALAVLSIVGIRPLRNSVL